MKSNIICYSIKVNLVIALFIVLLSVGFVPSIAQDEVAPIPGATNLALHKLASQSSTLTDWGGIWYASRGVDGVKTGNLWDGGSHTANEANPWWQVDLGAGYDLGYALIYNRQDCCGERSRSLEVLLSDDGQSWQSVYKHNGSIFGGGADGHPLKVDLNGQMARFLRVQLRETNWLQLDEVEIFGSSDKNMATIDGVFQISDSPWESAAPQTGASSISGPSTATDWYNKGLALKEQGKYDEAIQAYDEAIRLDPNYAEAWYKKGNALIGQGKYDEAIQAYDEAIRLDPNYAKAWYNKGTALYSQGKYDEAIEAYDEAIRLDPKLAEPWDNKGSALAHQGKYDEAIQAYDEAIRLDPNDAKTWNNKGVSLEDQGKYDEAIEAYDETIRLDPKLAVAWYNKGNALKKLGEYDEAIKAYDEVIRLNPDFIDFAKKNRENAIDARSKRQTESGSSEAELQNEEETDGKAQKDESIIMDTWDIGSVDNNPICSPFFTLDEPQMITYIDTYHWNHGIGAPGGTIGLRNGDGTLYGPWEAETALDQGEVPKGYWIAHPNEVIPAGAYIVEDSDPATWSQNSESPCGFSKVLGVPEASEEVGKDAKNRQDEINDKNMVPAGAEESKNVVMMAAQALKEDDVKSFMKFFTNDTVTQVVDEFSIPPEDASKVAEALKNARVVEVYPLIVLYEMEIDERTYNFYAMWEGDEWKLNGF